MNKNEQVRAKILHKWSENSTMSYKKLAKEVGTSYQTVRRTILKFKCGQGIEDKPRKGRPTGPADKKLEKRVINIIKANKCMSVRDVAKKAGTSHQMVVKIKKRNNIKTYKKQKAPKRTKKQTIKSISLARKLYEKEFSKKNQCVVMDDETYLKMDFSTIPGPQYYSLVPGEVVDDSERTIKIKKFEEKVLIWQAICQCGSRSAPFFYRGTINTDIYIKECMQKRLLPFLRKHDGSTIFWPDLAPAHYSKSTVKWYKDNEIHFVPKSLNPPNVPELRPIERYWAIMKNKLRRTRKEAKTMEQLKVLWRNATKSVTNVVVQNLMEGIARKTRLYGRQKLPE